MELDSVREVKATLREDGAVRATGVGAAALGVAVARPGGYRLAVASQTTRRPRRRGWTTPAGPLAARSTSAPWGWCGR